MTKKDFELIADQLAASTMTANLTETQRDDLALNFAGALRRTNERFDCWRFLTAAGMEDTPENFQEARRYNLV